MQEPPTDIPAPELSPGDRLGDFEIAAPLGRGGMGVVYVARQLSLGGRRVALKVLPADQQGEDQKRRFRREVRSLAGLHHENLAEVHGFGEEHGWLFYAMRLVQGPTLRDFIAERRAQGPVLERRAQRRCVRWVCGVAAALKVVHDAGLVHRDVKPANIVLDVEAAEDQAVLVDFGLVRLVSVDSMVMTAAPAATLAFAPPEQILGRKPGPAADVFALGVSLHDLLSGRLPEDRHQASAGLDPLDEVVPGIDSDLAAVVAKATDPLAEWRYPDASALLDDLSAWMSGAVVSARRPPWPERARRWARAHPGWILRGAGALFASVLLAVGISTTFGWLATARAATHAGREMRLVDLARSVRSLPPIIGPWLLRDHTSRELATSLQRDSEDNPLLEIVRLLETGDDESALFATATHLARDGLAEHPQLVGYLASRLAQSARVEPSAPTQRVSLVFLLAARLFFERPDETLEDQSASAPLRESLLQALENLAPTRRRDRHFALSALSGCATTADLLGLIAYAQADAEDREQLRLGVSCVERSIRRAQRCGSLDTDSVRGWLRSLTPALRAMHDPAEDASLVRVAKSTAEPLAIAAYSVGARDVIQELLPLTRESTFQRLVFESLGGQVDPCASLERDWPPAFHAFGWGSLQALLEPDPASDEITAALLRHARDSPSGAQLEAAFERGRTEFQARRRGERRIFRPDPDSLLGSPAVDPALREIPLQRRDEAHPGALWDLARGTPTCAGSATRLAVRNATFHSQPPERESPSFLRLWAFDSSEVRLTFMNPGTRSPEPWRLELSHVAACRGYLPNSGEVYLEFYLDDDQIGEALLPHVPGSGWINRPSTSLMVPVHRLSPGKHQLGIRLSNRTITTYRLVQVELLPPPEEK